MGQVVIVDAQENQWLPGEKFVPVVQGEAQGGVVCRHDDIVGRKTAQLKTQMFQKVLASLVDGQTFRIHELEIERHAGRLENATQPMDLLRKGGKGRVIGTDQQHPRPSGPYNAGEQAEQ